VILQAGLPSGIKPRGTKMILPDMTLEDDGESFVIMPRSMAAFEWLKTRFDNHECEGDLSIEQMCQIVTDARAAGFVVEDRS
jgi:hypothetical protein